MEKLKRSIAPPLGVKPIWVLEVHRIMELKSAIKRYMEANYPVPDEWVSEYNELIERNSKIEDI